MIERLEVAALGFADATEVEVRVKVSFITRGRERAPQPGNRTSQIALLNQVSADVVIRISEVGVNLNRLMAFGNCFVRQSHKAVRPAEKCVRLGGRAGGKRLAVEVGGGVQLAAHLRFVSRL